MKKFVLFLAVICLCLPLFGCKEEEKTTRMIAYLDETLEQAQKRSLMTSINQLEGVISCQYVTAEEALEEFLKAQEDEAAFAGIEASDLRDRIVIQVRQKDVEKLQALLEQIPGIAQVRSNRIDP